MRRAAVTASVGCKHLIILFAYDLKSHMCGASGTHVLLVANTDSCDALGRSSDIPRSCQCRPCHFPVPFSLFVRNSSSMAAI
jgi:hypothetical protein